MKIDEIPKKNTATAMACASPKALALPIIYVYIVYIVYIAYIVHSVYTSTASTSSTASTESTASAESTESSQSSASSQAPKEQPPALRAGVLPLYDRKDAWTM